MSLLANLHHIVREEGGQMLARLAESLYSSRVEKEIYGKGNGNDSERDKEYGGIV